MGALPAVGGLVVLCLLFALLSRFFFTERNFANLFNQAAPLVMLGMALVFVLLLGEIDLSAGVTGGNAMAIFVVLNANGVPWPLALLVGFLFGIAIGALIGFFVARVGIPSFVVTLGLFLGLQGLALLIIGEGGLYRLDVPELRALQNGNLPVWGGWVMLAIMLAISAGTSFWDRARRTRAGVPNRPISLVWIKLGVIAVLGGVVVYFLNLDRGQSINVVQGVPNIIPVTLVILWIGTFVLDRTKFGRYIYAIGGNAEAARRAGIKVRWIKWWAFVICSSLAVVAALFSVTRVGSVDATRRARHRPERCGGGGRRRRQPLRRTRSPHPRRDRRTGDRRHHERPRPARADVRHQPDGHRRRADPRRDRGRRVARAVRRRRPNLIVTVPG